MEFNITSADIAIPPRSYLVWYNGQTPFNASGRMSCWDCPSTSNFTYFRCLSSDAELSMRYDHWFCGPHRIPGAWCPNCNKALLCNLDLDAADPRLWLPHQGPSRVPLLYCWTCNISSIELSDGWYVSKADSIPEPLVVLGDRAPTLSAPFMYRVNLSGEVELLQYARGGATNSFPYENYPEYFPRAQALLVELDIEAEAAMHAENRRDAHGDRFLAAHPEMDAPRHQVGGEPYLVQKDVCLTMRCPSCADYMPRLAAIADDCLDSRGFTGEPFVQVIYHYCPSCAVVGCFNQTD
jgi:hypothetical protein